MLNIQAQRHRLFLSDFVFDNSTLRISLTLAGEQAWRDIFYDGTTKLEPGAVACPAVPCFTCLGNFQTLTSREDTALLKQLTDYCIRTDFPHLGEPSPTVYRQWFEEVCRTTAEMVMHWMRVGFVHGVMNTDNMSILSLTIDYGPYGWLEDYDPNWTPNTTDAGGRRYRFGNQSQVALWNLVQLANTIYPLIDETAPLEQALEGYQAHYQQEYQTMMAQKLGLVAFDPQSDEALVSELLEVLQLVETDMTLFCRLLADVKCQNTLTVETSDEALMAPLMDAYYDPDQLTDEHKTRTGNWLRSYRARVLKDTTTDDSRRKQMNSVNPKYVLRNRISQ